MTNIQYQRWKAYMSKGLMPPPYLDTIVHDAMTPSDWMPDTLPEPDPEFILCHLCGETLIKNYGITCAWIPYCSDCIQREGV